MREGDERGRGRRQKEGEREKRKRERRRKKQKVSALLKEIKVKITPYLRSASLNST